MYVGCKNSNLKLNQSAYKIGFRIIDICLKDSFSREPTINRRDDAIIDEFKPPQHDIATQIGTFKKFISGTVHIAANYLEGHLENRGPGKFVRSLLWSGFFVLDQYVATRLRVHRLIYYQKCIFLEQ